MRSGRLYIKRVYEPVAPGDGFRILVDRLWPRGLAKSAGKFDHWMKAIAPSPDLRKWFGHRPERFPAFKEKYTSELKENPEFETLRELLRQHEVVTLVYAARNEAHNHARVLQHLLEQPEGDKSS